MVDCEIDADTLSNEISKIAIESNLDLREYIVKVEEKLENLEHESIESYVNTGPNILVLHKKISGCCKTLERMESILSNFHKDLGAISTDIQDLQTRSLKMHQRLQNRQAVRGELSQFLSDMVVPETMIKHIILTPVTDQEFIETLHELDHKISLVFGQFLQAYPSYQDVGSILKKLKLKAVTKVREFLLEKVRILRKPMANYQVPQNQLLKHRYFYEFLLIHEKSAAREVRLSYIGTMEKVYFSYFKTYALKLLNLQMDSSSKKDDLVGKKLDDLGAWLQGGGIGTGVMTASGRSGVSSGSSLGSNAATGLPSNSRPGQFGLGDRADRLFSGEGLQAAILLPHAAAKGESRYPIEQIFRSINYALLDTTCREYLFLGDFFLHGFGSPVASPSASSAKKTVKLPTSVTAADSLFNKVFGRTLGMLETTVMPPLIVAGQYDLLGLMLCVQLIHAMISLTNERNVPVLSAYWESLSNLLWTRVVERLEAHITSLRNMDVSHFGQAAASYLPRSSRGSSINEAAAINLTPRAYCLIRPHSVARRYAELAASLHSIGRTLSKSPSSEYVPLEDGERKLSSSTSSLDARIILSLSRMHVEFEAAIYRLSKMLPRERLRFVFLINNFDLIISVLSEKGAANAPEVLRCREVVAMHTSAYIDQALLPYFGSMIGFIISVENRHRGSTGAESCNFTDDQDPMTESINEEARVTHIVKGFNIDWKNSIEKINGEIMLEFANFTLGTQIFQALLAQFVQAYHRFQNVMAQPPYNSMPVRNQIASIQQIMNEIKHFKSNF